jgi:hypothetical protein
MKVKKMKIVSTRLLSSLVLASAVLVTGCATKFERQGFDGKAGAGISKLTVTQWNDQEENRAVIINHPGMSMGLIGAAIAAADTSNKTCKLNAAVPPESAKVASAFYSELLPMLKGMGYEVTLVPAKRGDKIDDVKAAVNKPQGQDASLFLNISSGYYALNASSDYFPANTLSATLTDAKSGKVLYNDLIQYGFNPGSNDMSFVRAANECKFKDIDALTANPTTTRTCLMTGPALLAKELANELKK